MAFCITLDGSQNDTWVQFLDAFPGEAHTIQSARTKVFDHDVGTLDHLFQQFLAFRGLHVQFDRTLVAVEHREVQGVNVWFVSQPATSHIAGTATFNFDDICAQETHHLRTSRTCLNVGKVEHVNSI